MKNLENLSPSDIKAYVAGLRDEENKGKLIAIIAVFSVVIGLLVAGLVYLIKSRCCECECDDWDEDWDDDDECCCSDDECCCTDKDIDKSIKVQKIEE